MQEQWKPIPNSNYEISNLGNLRHAEDKELRQPYPNNRGYLRIGLWINGQDATMSIHRMVATAFVPNPYDKPQVNHIDGDKTNNRADNLEWVTQSENMKHAVLHGLAADQRGENNSNSKLTNADVVDILFRYHEVGETQVSLAKEYGVHSTTIGAVVNGRSFPEVHAEFQVV